MNVTATEPLWAALDAEGVEYALVGGLAMYVHGLPRFTEDIDVFVSLEKENVERLKRALKAVFADPSIDEIEFEDLSGEYPVIRYLPPNGGAAIDIIGRLGERIGFDDLEVFERPIGATVVKVVTPASLHWMKASTVRPIDAQDAERLRQAFDL